LKQTSWFIKGNNNKIIKKEEEEDERCSKQLVVLQSAASKHHRRLRTALEAGVAAAHQHTPIGESEVKNLNKKNRKENRKIGKKKLSREE
jgi:hypothetical protein